VDLRTASVVETSSGFELVAPGFVISVVRGKPKKLPALLRDNIARLRVFGVALEDMLVIEREEGNETGVPKVALQLMEFIERHGFNKEGIFRVAGKPSVMAALQTALNNRSTQLDYTAVTAHDVAHLFKRFLAELPEPLLTQDGYRRFMAIQPPKDECQLQRFIDAAKAIIRGLPQAHRELARVVFAFRSVCADCQAKTKMGVANLAITLAPVILRPANSATGSLDATVVVIPDLACVTKANEIVKLMIENHFDVFC
jgi:hypothetical protein